MSKKLKLDATLVTGLMGAPNGPYDYARKIAAYYDDQLLNEGGDALAGSFVAIFNEMREQGIIDDAQRRTLYTMCGEDKKEKRLHHELTLIANQAAANVENGQPPQITDEQFDEIEQRGTEFYIRSVSPFGHLFR